MGATFSRVKNWTTETLTDGDLDAEFDNILDNLGPAGVDDYSSNAAQMRTQTSPGSVGSESLASSLAGELERLRYVIQRILGSDTDYWYEAPSSTLTDLVAAIGTGLPTYRIVSGRTTGNSSQLCALIPSGTTASVTLSASVTPFVYYVAGTQYSITANVTLTGLSLAGALANNTCSFNNTAATGQQWTRFIGMYGTQIDVNEMQTTMSTVANQVVGLKAGNEYFFGYLNGTTAITNCWRGAMFNQSANNVTAVGLSNDAEIALMKLAWVFANTSSSLAVTYANPTISAEQPTSPGTGDYWFDLATTAWKTFNSTDWVAANATLIGLTMQNTVACVAARTFDSYKAMSALNTMTLERTSNTVVRAAEPYAEVSVFGSTNRFQNSKPSWDITADLESGMTESVSYTYFTYMKENGNTVLSDRNPIHRRDLQGLYHPAEAWRCLGMVYNNSSTHFETPVNSFRDIGRAQALMGDIKAYLDYSETTPLELGFAAAHAFPSSYMQTLGASENFTLAQGSFQPNATLSLTRGLWHLTGILAANWTGTPAAGAQVSVLINTAAGTASTGIQSRINQLDYPVGGIISNEVSACVHKYPVFASETTTYYLKYAIVGTTGATYAASSRIIAERIDDHVGMP